MQTKCEQLHRILSFHLGQQRQNLWEGSCFTGTPICLTPVDQKLFKTRRFQRFHDFGNVKFWRIWLLGDSVSVWDQIELWGHNFSPGALNHPSIYRFCPNCGVSKKEYSAPTSCPLFHTPMVGPVRNLVIVSFFIVVLVGWFLCRRLQWKIVSWMTVYTLLLSLLSVLFNSTTT